MVKENNWYVFYLIQVIIAILSLLVFGRTVGLAFLLSIPTILIVSGILTIRKKRITTGYQSFLETWIWGTVFSVVWLLITQLSSLDDLPWKLIIMTLGIVTLPLLMWASLNFLLFKGFLLKKKPGAA